MGSYYTVETVECHGQNKVDPAQGRRKHDWNPKRTVNTWSRRQQVMFSSKIDEQTWNKKFIFRKIIAMCFSFEKKFFLQLIRQSATERSH